ncbi:MAG TPA: cytochrome c oxidase subunit 3 [Pirellulales bacterium]|jgi:cytochrome c oxidase subunit 3|nr:cytochrome c oxidase subunit 3 [Pirellulales bacterium]
MSLDTLFTDNERELFEYSMLKRHRLEEQFENLEQQTHAASTAMWVFLATEVMFFGTLFVTLAIYRLLYGEAFEHASSRMNWIIGGTNTIVLLISSCTIVLALHFTRLGQNRKAAWLLATTAALGLLFLVLKGTEYYGDWRENLLPGWKFDAHEWTRGGLSEDQVPHVKLFLVFYWVMTAFHGLHVTGGIVAVGIIAVLAARGHFSPAYYSPVDVVALYWHFVDVVWIFLLPMLYLSGTHTLGGS